MLKAPKMYLPKLGGIGPSIVKFWTTHTLSKERFFCHKIHEDECDRSEYNISRGENMKALQHWGCHNVSEIWVTAATLSSFLQYMLLSEDLMMIFSFDLMCSGCPFSYKWCSKMPKKQMWPIPTSGLSSRQEHRSHHFDDVEQSWTFYFWNSKPTLCMQRFAQLAFFEFFPTCKHWKLRTLLFLNRSAASSCFTALAKGCRVRF